MALKKLKERRARRIREGKWTLGEKLSKAGRSRAKARKTGAPSPAALSKMTKEDLARKKKIGAKKSTAVRKGAKKVVKTKGGEYVKYGKKTEAAKSFRSTFKAKCADGAESFTWDGRSYSCAKKGAAKKTTKTQTKTKTPTKTIKKREIPQYGFPRNVYEKLKKK